MICVFVSVDKARPEKRDCLTVYYSDVSRFKIECIKSQSE
jgi:hypothetical protein